ncbi:amino acid adenylation domain-containing protein [Amycolatopsis sp. NPDC054798]
MPTADVHRLQNPVSGLHGLFEAQVSRSPEAVALLGEGGLRLTYAELEGRASQLARQLVDRGIGPADLVAIALDRSPDLIAGLLAILKSGAAFLPVDTGYPVERIGYLFADAKPTLVLTDSATATTLPPAPLLLTDAGETGRLDPDEPRRPGRTVLPDQAAYVVYTSGSTGSPKGVVIPHKSIMNYLAWMADEYSLTAEDRVLQKTPAGFDGAMLEFFLPLTAGAAMVLARPGGHREPEYVADVIARHRVTIAQFVPSLLPVFLDDELVGLCRSLRRVYSASDALPVAVQRRFHQCLNAELVNLYGPTETTVDTAHWRCSPDPDARSVPIGSAVRGMRLEVLDVRLGRVPAGETGEIYAAGVQLARGYLGQPALTAQRFVADPYGSRGERLYRTGDLGRKRADGMLEFVGRADGQVKIRGVRVEPAEVEAALAEHPSVRQSAAKALARPSGEQILVAYVVLQQGTTFHAEEIREHLRRSLPDAMVPSAVVFLEELPTTPNEKLDRAALPVPDFGPAVNAQSTPTDSADGLLSLVRNVLGISQASAADSFIGLGGDSISAIRMASLARQAGWRISTGDVLRHQTLGALAATAARIDRMERPAKVAQDGIGPFAFTPIMCWLRALGGPTDGFGQSAVLRTPADLGAPELLSCLQALLDTHDMLRARFPDVGATGAKQPETKPPGSVLAKDCLEVVDGTGIDDDDLFALARNALDRSRTQLRPGSARMLRVVWIRRDKGKQGRLALMVHHYAVDGVSLRILQSDLAEAWKSLRRNGTPRLEPVSLPYRRWAERVRRDALSPRRQRELAYWQAATGGRPTPLARRSVDPRLDTGVTAGTRRFELRPEQTELLLNRSPEVFGVEVNTVLVTGLVLALAHWRGTTDGDFLLNMEGHGRAELVPGDDLSRTVGWTTDLFPVRVRLSEAPSLEASAPGDGLRRAVREIEAQLAAIPDRGFGYGALRHLNPVTATQLAAGAHPELLFNYLGRFPEADGDDWSFDNEHDVAQDESDPRLPLGHALEVNALTMRRDGEPVLGAVWQWARSLFSTDEVARLAELWLRALTAIAEYAARTPAMPSVSLAALPAASTSDDLESEFRAF